MLALVIWSRRSKRGSGTPPFLAQQRGRLALTQIKKCAINFDNDFFLYIHKPDIFKNFIRKAL